MSGTSRGKSFLIVPAAVALALLVYLAGAATWAWLAADALLAAFPPPSRASALSPAQAQVLLKIEDPTFYAHSGLSVANGQGVATLTSALAREVFLSGHRLGGVKGAVQTFYRSVFNCCKRIDFGRDVMALVLDARLGKDAQLALFASTVYMGSLEGRQLVGLEQAATAYMGKPLPRLADNEFSALVAMIKAPNQFHPVKHPAAYAQRVARVDAVVSGNCRPNGWFDTDYAHCGP